MPPTTIFSIPPEVISVVGSYLDQRSLAHSLLVCHEWRSLFTSSFWRNVRNVGQHADTSFTTPESKEALFRNKHHIRVLETTQPWLIFNLTLQPELLPPQPSLPTPPIALEGLQSLTFRPYCPFLNVPRPTWSISKIREQEYEALRIAINNKLLNSILQVSTHLRSLTIVEGCFWDLDKNDVFLELTLHFPATTLERLHITFDRATRQVLKGVRLNLQDQFQDAILRYGPHPCFRALKEITFSTTCGYIIPTRMVFLLRCKSLERIRLEEVDMRFLELLPAVIQPILTLTKLEWVGKNDYEDKIIADVLLSSMSGWRVLRLPCMEKFGPLSFGALMESVETLEELTVDDWGMVDESWLWDFLCAARNLKRLEGLKDGAMDYDVYEMVLDASEAYFECGDGGERRTWALGPSMEYLQMQIVGIPRPDIVCRLSGGPLHLDPEDIDYDEWPDWGEVQMWIYEQLGRLTGLQELVVGILDQDLSKYADMGVHPWMSEVVLEETLLGDYFTFHYRCLEFSIASGLELLSGMKELRVLDVRSTAHRIGVEELEWMSVNWPKLEEVKGLYSCRGWTGDVEGNLKWKAAVDTWMVNHPRGIGSSFYL
ncbi:MAG: hypothetical protein JOS17DRAFT_741303 [Linnemannia elongata]|nr:MAG: hypothetical protein JOS17DRAFT_741303 [Linnemannia elongata]